MRILFDRRAARGCVRPLSGIVRNLNPGVSVQRIRLCDTRAVVVDGRCRKPDIKVHCSRVCAAAPYKVKQSLFKCLREAHLFPPLPFSSAFLTVRSPLTLIFECTFGLRPLFPLSVDTCIADYLRFSLDRAFKLHRKPRSSRNHRIVRHRASKGHIKSRTRANSRFSVSEAAEERRLILLKPRAVGIALTLS